MKTKLVKQDIEVKSDADMMRVLLDGYVVKEKGEQNILKLVNGEFLWTGNSTPNTFLLGARSYYIDRSYEIFKEEQVEWYEDIPEQGILCWCYDHEENSRYIAIVLKYDIASNFRFDTMDCCYRYAKPITEEEVKQFIKK